VGAHVLDGYGVAQALLAIRYMSDDAVGYEARPAASEAVVGSAVRARTPLNTPEKVQKIEQTLAELRPAFQADGGDCELVAVEADRVLVRMTGACVGCQLAGATVQGVQARLMKELNQLVRVIPVPPGYEP